MQVKTITIMVVLRDDGTQEIVHFHDTCDNLLDAIGVMQAGLRILEQEFAQKQQESDGNHGP